MVSTSVTSRAAAGMAALALWSTSAHALSCDEVLSMVKVGVPAGLIVQAVADAEPPLPTGSAACLRAGSAPAAIVQAAQASEAGDAPTSQSPPRAADRPAEPARPDRPTPKPVPASSGGIELFPEQPRAEDLPERRVWVRLGETDKGSQQRTMLGQRIDPVRWVPLEDEGKR